MLWFSEDLESSSIQFSRKSRDLRRKMCCSNIRMTLILILVVTVIIVVIVVIILSKFFTRFVNGHHMYKYLFMYVFNKDWSPLPSYLVIPSQNIWYFPRFCWAWSSMKRFSHISQKSMLWPYPMGKLLHWINDITHARHARHDYSK